MYLVGQGHEHLGPGTSLVQRINWTGAEEAEMRGFGRVGGVAEFYPDCRAMSRSCAERGLGCACGGKCSAGCGLGLFDGGLDPSTWGPAEIAIVALGGYMLVSTVFTTKRAAGRLAAIPGERRKKKAAYYRARAAELSKSK